MHKKLKKILVGSFILAFSFGSMSPVFAQLGEVPISHPGLGRGGIIGGVVSEAARTALSGFVATNEGCKVGEDAFRVANQATEIAMDGFSLIGGSGVDALELELKITAVEGFIQCRQGVAKSLKGVVVPNIFVGQDKQRLQDEVNLAIQTLQERKDDLQSQLRNAKRSFWKSFMIKSLLETSRVVAGDLVNRMANKFRVFDFLGYADAVAGQVYTTQMIKANAKDNQDQLILRSLVNNQVLGATLPPAVTQRADKALGFDYQNFNVNDPSFYTQMARVGASDTNPYMVQVAMADDALRMHSQGRQSALAEISQSSGFKAPRTCSGSIAEQQAIDFEYASASQEVADRQSLLNDLKNFRQVNVKLISAEELASLDSEIALVQTELDNALVRLDAVPEVPGGPVKTICEEISSPARMVDIGIDKVFEQFTRGLSDFKDDNLPFYTSFLSDIATNVATNLIYSGNAKTSILMESGNLATAAGIGLTIATQNNQQNIRGGVNFIAEELGDGRYKLSWEVNTAVLKDAAYVKMLEGTGHTDIQIGEPLQLAGESVVQLLTDDSYSFVLGVYDAEDNNIGGGELNVTHGEVKGISTSLVKQGIHPRGPQK